MIRRSLPAAALVLTLAACGGRGDDSGPPQLNLACQIVPCECVQEGGGMFLTRDKAELVWKENGDAACPAGYMLRRTE
ncbi:MAG: hypothetical protein WD470_03375 [Rhodospirillaceae bacterium]